MHRLLHVSPIISSCIVWGGHILLQLRYSISLSLKKRLPFLLITHLITIVPEYRLKHNSVLLPDRWTITIAPPKNMIFFYWHVIYWHIHIISNAYYRLQPHLFKARYIHRSSVEAPQNSKGTTSPSYANYLYPIQRVHHELPSPLTNFRYTSTIHSHWKTKRIQHAPRWNCKRDCSTI